MRARSHRLRLNRTRRMFFEKDELLKLPDIPICHSTIRDCHSANRWMAALPLLRKKQKPVNVSISFFFRYFTWWKSARIQFKIKQNCRTSKQLFNRRNLITPFCYIRKMSTASTKYCKINLAMVKWIASQSTAQVASMQMAPQHCYY